MAAVILFSFRADGALIRAVDRDALLAFKAGISSDPVGILATWNPKFDCANEKQWLGVYCQGTVVTKVILSDQRLSGIISTSIGKLTSLVSLRLSNNNFRGSIPTVLNFPSLSELYLNHNQLSGTIPASITKLKNLAFLSLNNNDLKGYIPGLIGDLKNLRLLALQGNKLRGDLPSSIVKLPNLNILSLNNNALTGNLPTGLGELKSLNYLYLQKNRFGGGIPPSIGSIPYLQRIDLSFNKFWGTIPTSMGSLKYLNELSLEGNLFNGGVPPVLGSLPLNTLNLKNNFFTGILKLSLPSCDSFYFRGVNISSNYFMKTEITCNGKPYCPFLNDNCIFGNYFPKNCPFSTQKLFGTCSKFCNSVQGEGACGGHGSCSVPSNGIPYCRCNPGYHNPRPLYYTCVLIPPKAPRKQKPKK